MEKNKQITNFNIIRAICAVCVFLYHAYYNMSISYGFLNPIIKQSAFFMTTFFMLSGFVLFYNYSNEDFHSKDKLQNFFVKRIVSIYPYYLLVWIIYFVIQWKNPVVNDIATFPLQVSLLQNTSHYMYLMNSGTWFFSCILICYLFTPYLIILINHIDKKKVIYFAIICVLILIFSMSQTGRIYSVDVYQNAFGRMFEFGIGMLACRLYMIKKQNGEVIKGFGIALPVSLISVGIIYILMMNISTLQYNELYKGINAILGFFILYAYAMEEDKAYMKFAKCKLVVFFSKYSLCFWVATFFTTDIYNAFLRTRIDTFDKSNLIAAIITFLINTMLAIALKQYEKVIRKVINKYSLKRAMIFVLVLFTLFFTIKIGYVMPKYISNNSNHYTEGKILYFDKENYNCKAYIKNGISIPENDFSWTDGYEAELYLKNQKAGKYKAQWEIGGVYTGSQTIEIFVNDQKVYDAVLSEEQTSIVYEYQITDGDVEIKMLFPNAVSPKELGQSNDERILALQLKTLQIVESE